MSNRKPYQYTYHKPMQVSMPESLYSVVYSETAFRGLTQHPSHFHTIRDAQAFIAMIVSSHTNKTPTSYKCLSSPHPYSHNNPA
jgi:hypothetical protein